LHAAPRCAIDPPQCETGDGSVTYFEWDGSVTYFEWRYWRSRLDGDLICDHPRGRDRLDGGEGVTICGLHAAFRLGIVAGLRGSGFGTCDALDRSFVVLAGRAAEV
jgi:hypothetical protein